MKKRRHSHVERDDDLWDSEQSRIADLVNESEARLRQFLDHLNAEKATMLRRPLRKVRRPKPPAC